LKLPIPKEACQKIDAHEAVKLLNGSDVVVKILVLRLFFPRQIVPDEPRRMVGHHLPAGIYGFLAGIKKLNFLLPLQRTETPHA